MNEFISASDMSIPRVLAVEKDARVIADLKELCERWKVELDVVEEAESGLECLSQREYWLVVAAVELPGTTGLELLRRIKRRQAEIPVVLVAENPEVGEAVRAMKSGASDYLDKPVSRETLELSLMGLMERFGPSEQEVRGAEGSWSSGVRSEESEGTTGLGGETMQLERPARRMSTRLLTGNKMMRSAINQALSLADVRAPVLLEGETGVGKALLAEEMHRYSRRRGPFVQVTCTALAEYLLASELFGHVRGAFSGADRDRRGKLEAADGGVVFVDGIGEASLSLQRRLLRVLEDGVVERVGEGRPVPVDLKIIAATKTDLAELVWEGKFHEPLYHRLNVARVRIPPLRHRKGDIGLLAGSFLAEFHARHKHGPKELSEGCIKALEEYSWGGNVGELESVVHTAASLCPEGVMVLGRDHLPGVLSREPLKMKRSPMEGMGHNTALSHLLEQREKTFLERALEATDYNIQRSAKLLSISRPTLYAKMKRFGLERED